MFIDGLALAGYRSFGPKIQRMGPFSKINLFAGQNNSGKSNILRFIAHHLPKIVNEHHGNVAPSSLFDDLDRHRPISEGFSLGLGLNPNGQRCTKLRGELSEPLQKHFNAVFARAELTRDTGCAWFDRSASTWGQRLVDTPDSVRRFINTTADQPIAWLELTRGLYPSLEPLSVKAAAKAVHDALAPFNATYPPADLIPGIRRVGEKGTTAADFSGTGLIERLAALQNPNYNEQEKKGTFDQINQFLQTVVGNDTASLEIPYERNTILIHMDRKVLPLASLGTGIHETIILAAAATVLGNQIVCIEEPELHLHPVLQRKLIRYLYENTSNQYFITTHSPHFLDSPDVVVFHVQLRKGRSYVSQAEDAPQKSSICADLGCRGSDLMQANCIVWVEGPSDRIYLRRWIHSMDPDLVEGIHYSIMFYGGRLLSHLTANDPEVDDFISLRRLNRNLVIVIDSDKDAPRKHINKTKKRVQREFDKGPGFAWVTKGREIENYVPTDLLAQAVEGVKPGLGRDVKPGQYDRALPCTSSGSKSAVDKIKVAHSVADHPANLDILDLKTQVTRLVKFIGNCNE